MNKNYVDDAPKVIAIDTGITTGYCVMDIMLGTVIESGNIPYNTEQLQDILKKLKDKYGSKDVIVEYAKTPTMSALDAEIAAVNHIVTNIFPKAVGVNPGTWKNHRVNNKPILPAKWNDNKLSQHQKDSILIARYYIHEVCKRNF